VFDYTASVSQRSLETASYVWQEINHVTNERA